VAAIVLSGVGARAWAARRLRDELARARHDRKAGLLEQARHRLLRLSERWPHEDAVALELGRCELACDHPEEALAAWARASEQSVLSGRITLERARLMIGLGWFTEAEKVLMCAIDRPCPEAAGLRQLLVGVLMQQGRANDAQRLIERQWDDLGRSLQDDSDARLDLIREHVALDLEKDSLEVNMAQIRARPDVQDHGLRLARAHLAARSGQFDRARTELEAGLRRPA
jgi:hypothetical protein